MSAAETDSDAYVAVLRRRIWLTYLADEHYRRLMPRCSPETGLYTPWSRERLGPIPDDPVFRAELLARVEGKG